MSSYHLTAALVDQHRAARESDARRWRQARAAGRGAAIAGSARPRAQRPHPLARAGASLLSVLRPPRYVPESGSPGTRAWLRG